jgi:hypothetical protein
MLKPSRRDAVVPRARPALEELEQRLVPTVTYHNGPLLSHVEVQAVFYGSDWFTPANRQTAGQLQNYLSTLVNSSYMDMLYYAGYGVGRGRADSGYIANYNLAKNNPYVYLYDSSIRSNLLSLIGNGSLAPNDANRLYMVFVEPGVPVWSGGHTLGYHSFIPYYAGNAYYAVIPYPGGVNANISNFWPYYGITAVASHELAEGVTDPLFGYYSYYGWYGGWFDSNPYQGEIGDLGLNHYLDPYPFVWLNGAVVEKEAGQSDWPLSPYGSTQLYNTDSASARSAIAAPSFSPMLDATPLHTLLPLLKRASAATHPVVDAACALADALEP